MKMLGVRICRVCEKPKSIRLDFHGPTKRIKRPRVCKACATRAERERRRLRGQVQDPYDFVPSRLGKVASERLMRHYGPSMRKVALTVGVPEKSFRDIYLQRHARAKRANVETIVRAALALRENTNV